MKRSLAWLLLVVTWLATSAADAAVTATPATIAIGNTTVGQAKPGTTSVDTSLATETIASFDLSTCSGDVAVTTATPVVLTIGVPKPIAVSFSPTTRGAQSCTVTMRNAGNAAIGTFQVTGTGVAQVLTVVPTSLPFGQVRVGHMVSGTVTLVNTGDVGFPLQINSVAVTGGAVGDYTVTSPTTFPQVIAPGNTLDVTVVFDPGALGLRNATLTIMSDDPVNPNQTVALTGTGTTAVIAVSDVAFGTVPDTTTVAGTINVTNSATINPGTLTVTSAVISTATSTWFTFAAGNGCVAGSTSCTFTSQSAPLAVGVRCTPPAAASGTQSTTVTFTSDSDPGGDAVAMLTCTAGRPNVMVDVSSLGFGNQLVATTSAPQTVTVSNTGTTSLTFWIAKAGANPTQFAFSTMSGCGTTAANQCTVPAAMSLPVAVTFTPSSPGGKSGVLQISNNDPDLGNNPTDVAVSGTGTAPDATPSPTTLGFPATEVGKISMTQLLTITNTGSATLTVSSAAITSGASDFTVTSGTTGSQMTMLTPGQTETWTLACQPSTFGPRAGNFRVISNAFSAPTIDVPLSCTGQAGALTISPTSFDFMGVRIGDIATHTFVLSNPGNLPVTNISAMFATPGVGYTITSPSFPLASLAPGGTINVTVQLAPTAPTDGGPDNLVFSGTWGASATTATATLALKGAALVAGIDTNPHMLDFGNVRYDQSSTLTVGIINTATGATTQLKILSQSIALGTAVSGEFSIVQCSHLAVPVTCPTPVTPFTLTGMNDTLVVTIKVTPANRVAMLSATLNVHSDLGTNPDRAVPLTANSTTATLNISPGTGVLDFGAVDLDAGSVTQPITITNMGSGPLDLGAATKSSPNGTLGDFVFVGTGAQTIAPGAQATVMVTYTPTIERPPGQFDRASLTWQVTGVCGGGPSCSGPIAVMVMIQGRGIDRHIQVSPAPSFPDTFRNPGDQAPVLPVTIMNTGEATLSISAVMLTGDPIWQLQNPDPVDVPGNTSYDFKVRFAPTAAGKAPDGQLTIMNNDNGMPVATVMLHGNGLDRAVAIDPPVIDLGYIGVGLTTRLSLVAPTEQLHITSMDATHAFTIRQISLDDPSGTFAVESADGSPPLGIPLAPSSVDSFDVVFTPNAEGDFQTIATIYLDMDPTPQATVLIKGHGVFVETHGGGGCQVGGDPRVGLVIALGAVLAMRRRRRCILLLAAGATAAHADPARNLDVTVFDPVPATTGNAFHVIHPDVGGDGAWVVTALASYASDPLVLTTVQNSEAPIRARAMLQLGGAYSFLGRLELGARLPLYVQSGQVVDHSTMFGIAPVDGAARGDLTIHAKGQLWRGQALGGELTAGAVLELTLPTATDNQFAGSADPEGRALALATLASDATDHRLEIHLNAGAIVRARTRFLDVAQASGLTWGVGGTYRLANHLWGSAEVFGDMIPSGRYDAMGRASLMSTIELLAGAHYQAERWVRFGIAAGRGLTDGIGSPDLRAVVMVTMTPAAAALEPIHGTPPPGTGDADGDGIPDAKDRCPNEPEDKDGFQDEDGCPDLDNDRDGIPDAKDRCPNEPEDKDGFQDEDGCPDPDNDDDGIPDIKDRCPNEPEDKDGFQDEDGCPDPDNDHDGIPDTKDRCPNAPETINGFEDDDGCPDKGDSLVVLSPDRLELLDPVQWSGTKPAKASLNELGQVGATLRAHPELARLRVTVHVQPTSHADRDQELSDKRAAAVRDWLVQWGVAPERLEPRGLGGTKPLVPADQKNAAVVNDRLELIIMEKK